jgi:hypothetical protein
MELLEGLKILEAVTATLHKGHEHYEEQLKVLDIPGVTEALGLMSANCNADISALRMGMQLGVYLHIRQQENDKLEKLLGEVK